MASFKIHGESVHIDLEHPDMQDHKQRRNLLRLWLRQNRNAPEEERDARARELNLGLTSMRLVRESLKMELPVAPVLTQHWSPEDDR